MNQHHAAPQMPTYAPNGGATVYAPAVQQHPAYQHPVQPWGYGQPQAAQPVYTYAKRRQSVKAHLWLLLLTGGIGNVAYAYWANSKMAARTEW